MPTSATVQFNRFFDCGRVVRCTLPLRALVVLYGYQGADSDLEQRALTDQLFDAALGELSVVARGQPCMLVGDFNVEPTKIPCLAKGISAGLWVDPGLWLLVNSLFLPVCVSGVLVVVLVVISWLGAFLLLPLFCLARFSRTGGLPLILLLGPLLTMAVGLVESAGSVFSSLACFLVACC